MLSVRTTAAARGWVLCSAARAARMFREEIMGYGCVVLSWWRSDGRLGEGTVVIWCGLVWGEEKKEKAMEKRSRLWMERWRRNRLGLD